MSINKKHHSIKDKNKMNKMNLKEQAVNSKKNNRYPNNKMKNRRRMKFRIEI